MKRTFTFTIELTIPGRSAQIVQRRLAKALKRKDIVRHRIIGLRNDYTGGCHTCPETLEEKTK